MTNNIKKLVKKWSKLLDKIDNPKKTIIIESEDCMLKTHRSYLEDSNSIPRDKKSSKRKKR